MDLRNILLDYYNNKKSLDEVIKSLSLFSVEYIENNIAQIDINRDFRKSIPEIILATHKKTSELILIANRVLEKKGYALVSKIKPLIVSKLIEYYSIGRENLIEYNMYKKEEYTENFHLNREKIINSIDKIDKLE